MMGKLARFIRFFTGEDEENPQPSDAALADEAVTDTAVLSE